MSTESTKQGAAQAADPQQQFMQAFRGSFTSALRWHHLDALWQRLNERAGDGWYIYAIGEEPPRKPSEADRVTTFIDEIDLLLVESHQLILKRDAGPSTPSLLAVMSAGMVNKNPSQRLRGYGEEMGAVVPLNPRLIDEFQIGFINQSRSLERVVGPLLTHEAPSEGAQFIVDAGQELI